MYEYIRQIYANFIVLFGLILSSVAGNALSPLEATAFDVTDNNRRLANIYNLIGACKILRVCTCVCAILCMCMWIYLRACVYFCQSYIYVYTHARTNTHAWMDNVKFMVLKLLRTRTGSALCHGMYVSVCLCVCVSVCA